jgi:signal transduction histidine kinase
MALTFMGREVPALTWGVLLRSLASGVGITLVIALAIATLLTVIGGGGFRTKLIYSLAISLCCWSVVDGVRRVIFWWMLRRALARGLPLPTDGPGWRVVLALVALTALIGPTAGLMIGDALTGIRSPSIFKVGDGGIRVTLAMTLIGTTIGLTIWAVQTRLGRARLAAEQAHKVAVEQQLLMLQTQLEPHMLFNTLANLRVLIGLDAAAAQQMLDRLIAYLRATLEASRLPAHPLATEYARVADYLALMAIRMGPRLQVVLDLPPGLAAQPVPPLLLQPLVENAIKHGLEPKPEGGTLTVQAEVAHGKLVVNVTDTGVGFGQANTAGTGTGLDNIRERLRLLYGDQARLEMSTPPGGGTQATVTLPYKAHEAAASATASRTAA